MSTLPRAQQRTNRIPSFFQIARDLYGDAFEARDRNEIGEAMSDWVELTTAEQGFALGHLLYLNLRGSAGIHLQLQDIRQLLSRIDDSLEAMANELAPERDEEEGTSDASLDIPVLPTPGAGTSADAEVPETTLGSPPESEPALTRETTPGLPLESKPVLLAETTLALPPQTTQALLRDATTALPGEGRGETTNETPDRGGVSLTLVATGRGTQEDVRADECAETVLNQDLNGEEKHHVK